MLTNHSMKKVLTYLLTLFVLGSCSHSYYIPTTANVPLLKEKNELRATLSGGGGGDISTVDFQGAYSVTNHFAVMTNFMSARGSDDDTNSSGSGNCFELGAGYFTPLEKNGVFEIYGGFGFSNQQHTYNSGGRADLAFRKIFVQPSIGLSLNSFDLAFTPGFSSVSFHKVDNQLLSTDVNFEEVDQIAKNNVSLLFEPALTIRAGWKHVKFQTQFGLARNLSHPNLEFEEFKVNVGLTFSLAERYRD